jgi:DNA-directed RNA polymerase subunit M/transcription elongation factor TFIIS
MDNTSKIKYCPQCRYYLYLQVNLENKTPDDKQTYLTRLCRNCGYEKRDNEGGMITETQLQRRENEGYKILLNKFTRQDPTLPHVKTIKCPSETCPTNTGKEDKDVIYIKYDPVNLKYLYICNVCDFQWRSRPD